MKTYKKIFIGIAVVLLITVSFFAGSYIKEQEYYKEREEKCLNFVSIALEAVENGDVSDPDVMKNLISNTYAAYEYCDFPIFTEQLYDLWAVLAFEGESYIALQDIAINELENILTGIKISN